MKSTFLPVRKPGGSLCRQALGEKASPRISTFLVLMLSGKEKEKEKRGPDLLL